MKSSKRFYPNDEAADYLGVSRVTLPAWRGRGMGPAFSRMGRRIVYDIADLEAFAKANRVEPGQEQT